MRLVYLAALLVSFAGVVLIDLRWRVALGRAPRRTAWTVLLALVGFLVWDAVGIAGGLFVRGDGRWSTGVELAPHFPLEELVFLTFLCYQALVAYLGARRALGAWAGARAARRRGVGTAS